MRHEPKVLEFGVDGKRLASGSAAITVKERAKWWPARLSEFGGWCAMLLVPMAICLVHAVLPGIEAVAGSSAADPSRQSSTQGAASTQGLASAKQQAKPKERAFHGALPQSVADMREQILAAIVAGEVSELRDAIEWNEIKPDFGKDADADPIAYWKKISSDGEGREVLAIAANLLSLAPARLAIGKDPENTLVYVWPYLAELPLDQLKPAEEVDLYRLVPPAAAKAMRDAKKWTWWRIAIGADGTWHTFRKYD
jgi:hypothetical protein